MPEEAYVNSDYDMIVQTLCHISFSFFVVSQHSLFLAQVREIADMHGLSNVLELYSECNEVVKAAKQDSKGTVVQGNHKSYR